MKSNVCKLQKGAVDLHPILAETERVALYNELSQKEALWLQLLAEELVGLLLMLVKNFDGEFWIESRGTSYELHAKMSVEDMDLETRDELIKISSNRKNAASVGIIGKICAVFDYMALGGNESEMLSPAGRYGLSTTVDFSQLWSLQQYRDHLSADEVLQWDELEKSIIAKLADDVTVGVRRKTVTVIIKKNFEVNKQ